MPLIAMLLTVHLSSFTTLTTSSTLVLMLIFRLRKVISFTAMLLGMISRAVKSLILTMSYETLLVRRFVYGVWDKTKTEQTRRVPTGYAGKGPCSVLPEVEKWNLCNFYTTLLYFFMADIIEAGMLERGDLFRIPGKEGEFQCFGWHRNLDMIMYCGVDEFDIVRYIRPFHEVEVDNYYF